ncbi:hypothetical protein ACS0TY_008972 [Phlomoides rotata]
MFSPSLPRVRSRTKEILAEPRNTYSFANPSKEGGSQAQAKREKQGELPEPVISPHGFKLVMSELFSAQSPCHLPSHLCP